jgi:hypothetical protein
MIHLKARARWIIGTAVTRSDKQKLRAKMVLMSAEGCRTQDICKP